MDRRTLVLVISLITVLILAGGCKEATRIPSPVAEVEATEPGGIDTPVPSTPTTEPTPTAVEEAAVEPTEPSALPEGPALVAPPDEAAGTVFDLVWAWEQELGEDEWFELQIWPDDPAAEPEAYDWYKETEERVTSATLSPGRYLWQVLVVQGREDERGEVMELDYVEPMRFTLVRPSLRRGEPGLRPVATDTPTPTGPTATPTETLEPTDTPQPTATDTPMPPTATDTPDAYHAPTDTPELPSPTDTPDAY